MVVDVMAVDRDRITSNFRGNAPVTLAEVQNFETSAGLRLPADYADFLQWSNGGEGFIGPKAYVILWKLGDLVEMNEAYQVSEYAPGLFIFGSDGGGEAFAFDIRTSGMPIVSIPFVGMDRSLTQVVAPTFNDFLEALAKG
jgi:hypothetical protein